MPMGCLISRGRRSSRGRARARHSLLRADFGVVPYLFRDANWLPRWPGARMPDVDDRRMAIERVAASGGAGKTRFAIELCQRVLRLGWVAGCGAGMPGWRRSRCRAWWLSTMPRTSIWPTCKRLCDRPASATRTAWRPVRVLLLSRTRAGRTQDPLDALLEGPRPPRWRGWWTLVRTTRLPRRCRPAQRQRVVCARGGGTLQAGGRRHGA